jgi:hypothetical protein
VSDVTNVKVPVFCQPSAKSLGLAKCKDLPIQRSPIYEKSLLLEGSKDSPACPPVKAVSRLRQEWNWWNNCDGGRIG